MLYPYVEFTLDDLLKYLRPGSDRFPNTTVKALMHQLVDAVSYCHEMGIMHRNLKPKHILLKRRGEQTPIFDFSVFVHSPADITLLVSDFALTRNAVLMSAPMTDQVRRSRQFFFIYLLSIDYILTMIPKRLFAKLLIYLVLFCL